MPNIKKKIIILGFGGTIAMVPDTNGILKPAKSIDEILSIVPTLREQADIRFEQIENLDSTNINPTHWKKLILKISEVCDQYDGIIITHGTDTMAYTASAVSLGLGRGLKIPIIFTGSQLPLVSFGTDARFNLENSMKALLRAIEGSINEVMIVFSDRVLRASRAIKTSESKFAAFDSPAYPDLAYVNAVGVSFNPNAFTVEKESQFLIKPDFQKGIFAIDLVPGLDPKLFLEFLKSGSCTGVLLKSLGAGNVPSFGEYSLIPVIEEATKMNIPVLISTKFVGGNTHPEIYEPGKLAVNAGAIPTGDLTDVMAQVKFMWALALGHKSHAELREVINTSFVGEITGK